MRTICDAAYVMRADEVVARARQERLVAATLMAAGFKNEDGSKLELVSEDAELAGFVERLERPLDWEARRAAALRVVAS